MKKLIFFVATICLLIIIYFTTVTTHTESNHPSQYSIDLANNIVVDFQGARIRIIGWDNNFVQIKADDTIIDSKGSINLVQEGNQLKLIDFHYPKDKNFMYKNNTWFTMAQYGENTEASDNFEVGIYDFVIKVPKDIPIEANAEVLKAYGCNFQAVSSPKAVIRNCKLADNYIGKGKNVEVRETDIGDNVFFKNRILKIRDCEAKNIVIGIDDITSILEGEVRNVTGESIIIDAPDYKDLSLLVRDSTWNSFTVNSSNDTGDIRLRSSTIKNINNNSKIAIQSGDWNGWRY